jgi:hypothetical protein
LHEKNAPRQPGAWGGSCQMCNNGQVETPLEDVIGWVVERVDHDEDCSKPTRQGVRDCSCGLDELLALVQSEGE